MRTYLGAFLLSLIITALATPLVRRLAVRIGAVDEPGVRKVHSVTTARMGGLAIALGVLAALAAVLCLDNRISRSMIALGWRLWGPLTATGIILILGIYDDIKRTNARVKIPVQIACALIVWFSGVQLHEISSPFGANLHLGVFGLPFVVVWIVALTNAVNLIDGADGLAAGVSSIAASALFFTALRDQNILMAVMCACIAGSASGFLWHNFPPARVFMGDAGSLTLGFTFGWVSILASYKGAAVAALMAPALALGLPLVDVTAAVVRRVSSGAPVFSPDRQHIHHRLLQKGFSSRRLAVTFYGLGFMLMMGAIGLTYVKNPESAAILLVLCVGLLVAFGRNGFRAALGMPTRIDADLQALGRAAIDQMQAAGSVEDATGALAALLTDLGSPGGLLVVCRNGTMLAERSWGEPPAGGLWPHSMAWSAGEGGLRVELHMDLGGPPPSRDGAACFVVGGVLEGFGQVLSALEHSAAP